MEQELSRKLASSKSVTSLVENLRDDSRFFLGEMTEANQSAEKNIDELREDNVSRAYALKQANNTIRTLQSELDRCAGIPSSSSGAGFSPTGARTMCGCVLTGLNTLNPKP